MEIKTIDDMVEFLRIKAKYKVSPSDMIPTLPRPLIVNNKTGKVTGSKKHKLEVVK